MCFENNFSVSKKINNTRLDKVFNLLTPIKKAIQKGPSKKRLKMEPLKRFTQCGSLTMLFAVFIVLFGVSSTALTTFGKSPNPPPPPPTLPPGSYKNTIPVKKIHFIRIFITI